MHYSKDIEQIYKMKNKESLILKYKINLRKIIK